SGKDAEASFLREYARELLDDASQRDATRRLLLRATRLRPVDADNLHVLAGLSWEERNFTGAAQLYRLAACVADKTEYLFRSYFTAARQIRESAAAIAWLRRRFEQFGKRSSLPSRTLFWALNNLDRGTEAFAILEEALLLRPEDGDLLTFAADEYARIGRLERAMELLAAAHGRASRGTWLRTSGTIAENDSKLKRALQVWREVLALEPLALDANRAVARLIAEVDGRAATLDHLKEVCGRFSHHVPLHKLWLEWTLDPADRERILRVLLGLSPDDSWTHREMALLLAEKRCFEEAHRELQAAHAVEPVAPASHMVAGRVFYLEGKNAEAAEAYRRAISLSTDSDAAIEGLLLACPAFQEKREALEFVFQELKRQVSLGDGLLAYRDAAYTILEPENLLANLREALAARPDLWHAWSAVIAQLRVMSQLADALELARQASARFPLLPRIWYDLAQVHKVRREPKEEIAALERALETNPAWSYASRELSSAYERSGNLEGAEAVVVKAITAVPSDPFNRGFLADILWRKGEREAAIAEVERAIILNPDYDWAWQALREWSVEEGGENLALQAARDLVATRSGESRSWLRLAEALTKREEFAERLLAVDRALALNPRNVDAWDIRATFLAEEKRYQEALDSCRPEPFAENPPRSLRGRSAWIEAQRGRLDGAIEQMRAVVDAAPDYYWGWARLAEWHMQQEKPALALAAAEQMSRLQPENVAVLGYIGDARLGLDRREEAKEAFSHAWDLDPLYGYGAGKLFDLQLEDRKFPQAEAILERMKRHLEDAQVVANEVRLAAAQYDQKRAFAALAELCRRKGEIAYALVNSANQALVDAGWGKEAEKFFAKMIEQEEANPDVGAAWVKQLTYRKGWRWWKGVHRLRVETPAQKEALRSLLNAIGEEKRSWLLRYLLWRLRPAILLDDIAWGNVTYAMTHMGEFRRTIRWMQDWKSRPEIQPWMLLNLTVALRQFPREREAHEAGLAALELGVDHTTGAHCLFLAADEAIAGNFAEAERYHAQALEGPPPEETDLVAAAVEAMLNLHRTNPGERAGAVKEVRARLREKFTAAGKLDRASRRMYRHTLLRLAHDAGDRWGIVGAYLRTLPRPQISPAMWSVIRVAVVLLIILRRVWWPSASALFNYLRSFF
ncbi:MAG TPA: tetratricopeptide repeat protein, partial [Chthoniobacterales bacterium]|nr:tetratricopeptide repeat protein [Chthoniobacterales bacterium]